MGGLMEIRRRMMQSGLLPPTYKPCDFLQAQGDRAVIDSGVAGNNDLLRFELCFSVDRYIMYRGFFTNYASETANCWRLSEATQASSILFTSNTKTGSSGYTQINYIGQKTEVIIDKSSIEVTANGMTAKNTAPSAIGTENNTTIYINTSRRYAQTRDDVIKWYYFRIFDNGVPVRNYLPCIRKSDNKAGFFDAVNHTFNPSTGSSDFIAGYDA